MLLLDSHLGQGVEIVALPDHGQHLYLMQQLRHIEDVNPVT
jgi:hypothetical protein